MWRTRQARSRQPQLFFHPETIADSIPYERTYRAPSARWFEIRPPIEIIKTPGRSASSPPIRAARSLGFFHNRIRQSGDSFPAPRGSFGNIVNYPRLRNGSTKLREAGLSGFHPDNPDNPCIPLECVTDYLSITCKISAAIRKGRDFSRIRTNSRRRQPLPGTPSRGTRAFLRRLGQKR